MLPRHVVGVSAEPLLEDVRELLTAEHLTGLSWLIAGGESDQGAHRGRPCDVAWLRALADLRSSGVSVFVKQVGSHPVEGGARLSLKDGAGGDWAEWPEDLRVRELPAVPPRNAP